MSRDDFYASPLGAAYSAYMERPRLRKERSGLYMFFEARRATAALAP